jgi:pimeloyl-ACP methyl ester carboxylesterase
MTGMNDAFDLARVSASRSTNVPRIAVRGTSLAYVERGVGEPVIFVHGSLGSLRDFREQMKFFSRDYRAIAYSRRFHPPNGLDDTQAYTCHGHADDLAEVIRVFGTPSARVVASSWGGYAALACAVRHPGLISQLVLAEPPMLWLLRRSIEGKIAHNTFFRDVLIPAHKAFLQNRPADGVRLFYDGIAGEEGVFDRLHVVVRTWLLESAYELSREFLTPYTQYMAQISDDDIRHVTTPVLLLTAEHSPQFFHIITNELHRILPAAHLAKVPNAAHAMQLWNPGVYNHLVGDFFSSTYSGRSLPLATADTSLLVAR